MAQALHMPPLQSIVPPPPIEMLVVFQVKSIDWRISRPKMGGASEAQLYAGHTAAACKHDQREGQGVGAGDQEWGGEGSRGQGWGLP